MKFEIVETNKRAFANIKVGQKFIYDNDLYIKTNPAFMVDNAVDLECGILVIMMHSDMVDCVDFEEPIRLLKRG